MHLNSIKILLILILGVLLSCNDTPNEQHPPNSDTLSNVEDPLTTQKNTTDDDSVHVSLQLEKIDKDQYNFLIQLNLFGAAWIVSPLEKEYPYGEMTVTFDSLQADDHFVLIDSILENPTSTYKSDPNWESAYRVVQKNTRFKQQFKLLSNEDFEISGHIFFVLEPVCIPHTINFKIIYSGDELRVEQME